MWLGKKWKGMPCMPLTMRSLRLKFFIQTMVLLAYIIVFTLLMRRDYHRLFTPASSYLTLPYVVVHIDLKGAPPKLEYLESLLPTLKAHGANGLLMEYEDMFPYKGKLVNISSVNCYSRSELKSFLAKAVVSGFEIIPLIQTFGHLEHVLKLEEFRHLRETKLYTDSICPSKGESRDLIRNMLTQVLNFHNDIMPLKHIHFGCDEVYQINACEKCVGRNSSNVNIFLQHVRFLSEYLHGKSPDTTALIWDDMLRAKDPRPINMELRNVEIVYWDYAANLRVTHTNLLKYHRSFKNIWAASAFKGADGREATLPDMAERFLNHLSWLNRMVNYKFGGEKDVYTFKGIILTGWSRYTHIRPLCELLPVSLPSLILNLMLIERYTINKQIDIQVGADHFLDKYINVISISKKDINVSDFNLVGFNYESTLFSDLKRYEELKIAVDMFSSDEKTLFSIEYATKLDENYISKQKGWFQKTLNEIAIIETSLNNTMKHFYESYVINEYVHSKTYNLKEKIKKILQQFND